MFTKKQNIALWEELREIQHRLPLYGKWQLLRIRIIDFRKMPIGA